MITWNNLDTLESFKELSDVKKVNLAELERYVVSMQRKSV